MQRLGTFTAEVTSANIADDEQAPALIKVLPSGLRFLLGDQHYHDDEVEVRKLLHKTRSIAIENFN